MLLKTRLLKAGFTLTELMAVVIIIAVLSAMASGSYKKAVERSRISDGLLAASSVMEAVNRYYADNYPAGNANANYPKINQLDISFANQKPCTRASNYCVKTKFFEVTINRTGATNTASVYVDAKRMKGSLPGDYTIRVYASDFGNDRYKTPRCIGLTNPVGRDLCVSAGYTAQETSSGEILYYKP